MNAKENTLIIHVVPTGTYLVYRYADQIGFGLQTFGGRFLNIPHNNPNTKIQQEAPKSVIGRRAKGVNLVFPVAITLVHRGLC